jgi:membrane fusion protein (multidrug efflux system)
MTMSDDLPPPNHSITPASPEVITLNEKEAPPKHPWRTPILAILGMILLLAGFGGWKAMQISKAIAMGKAWKMPPDAVTSLTVKEESVEPVLEAVGSLSSPHGVMISADLPGIVTEIDFESGRTATNGQLLVQLDTRQEQAQLRTAKAKLELARQNLDRAIDLNAKKVIAQYEYDQAKSVFDSATSTVDEIQATIARKTLRAPFDGSLGIRQVNQGQYLKSGDPIVQLESLDPIYVNFALPQQWVGNLKQGQKITVMADGLPEKPFSGEITAINSMVDPATRNIQVQGTIGNPERLLRSGMFAGVRLQLPSRQHAVMVPSTSVQYAPYGDSVFVIGTMKDKDGKEYLGVTERTVVLGKTHGDQTEVLKGLRDGEQIATSGIFKLRNGGAVKVNNAVQPGNDPAPKPEDS